jgi:GT2 family glycosyltransferase
MSDLSFISVIIPTHNRAALLRQTLRCLTRQTYPAEKYEVIVVDNGSADDTAVYLQTLAQKGEVTYIRQSSLGPAVARNVGAKIAQGEILVFTDDDCLPEPQWLAALAAVYQDNRAAVAVGGKVKNVDAGHWLRHYYHIQAERRQHPNGSPRFLDTANASFRRAVFAQVGGFQERFHVPAAEDVEMGYRLAAAGYSLHFTPQAVVWHQGRTSLRGFFLQSWRRGLGQAMLMSEYPHYYFAQTRPGWRAFLRQQLDRLVRLACRTPKKTRPFVCAAAAAFRALLYLPPQIKFLFQTRYAYQFARSRASHASLLRRLLYVVLITIDNVLRLVGQVGGSFTYVYRQVKQNHKPKPFYQP